MFTLFPNKNFGTKSHKADNFFDNAELNFPFDGKQESSVVAILFVSVLLNTFVIKIQFLSSELVNFFLFGYKDRRRNNFTNDYNDKPFTGKTTFGNDDIQLLILLLLLKPKATLKKIGKTEKLQIIHSLSNCFVSQVQIVLLEKRSKTLVYAETRVVVVLLGNKMYSVWKSSIQEFHKYNVNSVDHNTQFTSGYFTPRTFSASTSQPQNDIRL